jgi:hypothetical protein
MVDIKEIKKIRAAPFTLMTSSIHAILAFIAAILLILFFGTIAALIPGMGLFASFITLLGLSIIILLPLTSFFLNIMYAFVLALLYNVLAARVGGIKLGMEGEEVKTIPVVSIALILSCVVAILTFIMGLYMGLAGSSVLSLISGIIPIAANVAANATNATDVSALPTGAGMAAISGIWALFWIILMPIVAFIFSFIGYALFALFYNVLIPKVGGIRLIFAEAANGFELTNIPVMPAAIALSVVSAIFGLLQGLLNLAQFSMMGDVLGGFMMLIVQIISSFIMTFIIVALATLIYNFLQPRIGGVKLVLE